MTTSKNLEISELARRLNVDDNNVSLTGVTIPSSSLQDTTVTAGTYGSKTLIPVITVNAKGQLTAVTTMTSTGIDLFTYDSATKTLDLTAAEGSVFSVPLTNLATETYVNDAVAAIVDSSPAALDTLNELAAALGDDPSFATTVSTQLGLKANTSSLSTVATSGSYNDLTNKPTMPSSFVDGDGWLFVGSTWKVKEVSGVLYFANGTTNRMKLDASGNLTVTGDVTAFGSV
jgi:hypothetical protein